MAALALGVGSASAVAPTCPAPFNAGYNLCTTAAGVVTCDLDAVGNVAGATANVYTAYDGVDRYLVAHGYDDAGTAFCSVLLTNGLNQLGTVKVFGSDYADDIEFGFGALTLKDIAAFAFGDASNDSIDGSDDATCDEELNGEEGNDVINGRGGNDDLNGGNGTDTISGGEGADIIDGGTGADTLNGDGGADAIDGQSGADIISGGDGADEIDGGWDNDSIKGDAGADTLYGGAGEDKICGGTAIDSLYGDQGDDELYGGPSGDFHHGDAGTNNLCGSGAFNTNCQGTITSCPI